MRNVLRQAQYKLLVVTVALMISAWNCVAQNLVPNPSFEEYTQCPWSLGVVEAVVPHWFVPTNTFASYFNACANTTQYPMFGVPNNSPIGYQVARTGQAYAALLLYTTASEFPDGRIYVATELIESLIADTIYCVEFFVSLSGHYWNMCAVADVGLHLSVDSIVDGDKDTLSFNPQIASSHDTILIDTIQWIKISGTYQAEGGEKFITIGNFLSNDQTNVVNTSGTVDAVYYIDDVSVQRCSQVGVSANALVVTGNRLSVYPNPAADQITVNRSSPAKATLQLTDALGRIVQTFTLETNIHQAVLNTSELPNGLYTAQLLDATNVQLRSKVLILR